MSTETPLTRDETNDSDSDVIGFADAPYPLEEPASAIGPALNPPLVTVTNTIAPNNTTTTTNATEPTQDSPPKTALKGWRRNVNNSINIILLFLPWTVGMIVSYMPLTRISAADAPREVLLCIITSTIEVGGIPLLPVIHLVACWVASLFGPRGAWIPEGCFKLWMFWLLVEPPATGGYVWKYVDTHPCETGSQSAQCKVGDGLIRAVGIVRAIGVPLLVAFAGVTSNLMEYALKKQQRLVDSRQRLTDI